MPAYEATWESYTVRYDPDGGDRTFVAEFPDKHEMAGPAGTLIGLLDLVERVFTAVEQGREEHIAGAYRWPPSGVFLSQTYRRQQLRPDDTDLDRIWSAKMAWTRIGERYTSDAVMNLYGWRALASALRRLINNPEVRHLEEAAAQPA